MTQHQFAGDVAEWMASLPDEDARDTAELYLAACADEAGGDLHLTLETAKEMYEEATNHTAAIQRAEGHKALDDEEDDADAESPTTNVGDAAYPQYARHRANEIEKRAEAKQRRDGAWWRGAAARAEAEHNAMH